MMLIEKIARLAYAYHNCRLIGNDQWALKHLEQLEELQSELPSGYGFDNGTIVNIEQSGKEKVVLLTDYHNINENGMYIGWSNFEVTFAVDFLGINCHIKTISQPENETICEYFIEDYVTEVFLESLYKQVD